MVIITLKKVKQESEAEASLNWVVRGGLSQETGCMSCDLNGKEVAAMGRAEGECSIYALKNLIPNSELKTTGK